MSGVVFGEQPRIATERLNYHALVRSIRSIDHIGAHILYDGPVYEGGYLITDFFFWSPELGGNTS
jgi:hypothetical protein